MGVGRPVRRRRPPRDVRPARRVTDAGPDRCPFRAMKVLVSVESRASDGTLLSPLRWAAFATLWPGMRPALMARLQHRTGAAACSRPGSAYVALGTALFLLAHAHLAPHRVPRGFPRFSCCPPSASSCTSGSSASWPGCGAWRARTSVRSFRAPWRAESLGEFLVAALEPRFLGDDVARGLSAHRRRAGDGPLRSPPRSSSPGSCTKSRSACPCAPVTASPCSTSRSTGR
jgi:hypothetical protein